MVDLTDTTKVSTMEGHEAPVLCVKFDPLTHYLVGNSSSSDVYASSLLFLSSLSPPPVVMVQLRYGQYRQRYSIYIYIISYIYIMCVCIIARFFFIRLKSSRKSMILCLPPHSVGCHGNPVKDR